MAYYLGSTIFNINKYSNPTMKLSIIIPAYNVEQYIEKCLKSCLEQDISHTDYEIIVVNDGSPDGSLAIAERIAATATNITIISQKNGGLGAARNTGLQAAKGEYVWFIDSDDWIETNCLASLSSLMDGADFIAISSKKIWSNHQECCYAEKASNGKDLMIKLAQQPAPYYIIKRDFLHRNNLMFKEGILHEDMEFTPRMVYLAEKIHTVQKCVYNYLQRENSIMTTPNPKRAFDLLKASNSLYRFKNEIVMSEHRYIYNNIISLGINNAFSIISQNSKKSQKEWLKELNNNKHLIKVLSQSSIKKYKLQGLILRSLPLNWSIGIYNIMQVLNVKKKKII